MRGALTRWRGAWERATLTDADFIERIPQSWIPLAILAASALTLYVELVLVRWHATCFHAFAIFKNVSLLSCFLGLGIGYGSSGRRRLALGAFLPLLAFQALLFGVLSNTNLGGRRINPVAEQLVMGTLAERWSWLSAVEGNGFLALVFVLNAVMFIPLGQLAGSLMGRLPQVRSYAFNLLGSLVGIGLFFLLSLAWTRPSVWMGVAVLGVAPFLLGSPRHVALGVGSLAVMLVALGLVGERQEQQFYSPYQVIALRLPEADAPLPTPTIRVNHCFYQDVMDCSPAARTRSERNDEAAIYYNLPYRLRPQPGAVLVVGAGTGNDVAAALRNEARSVTAVEINPAIQFLGQRIHPERPYQDPRTRAVLNDARSFLRQTEERFDTVIYGLLDSHTNLGAMTNVRLDSFVYTVEGFRDAVKRLNDDGLLIVSYLLLDDSQGAKLYAMLQQVYPEQPPRAFTNPAYMGTTFVTGPGLKKLSAKIADIEETSESYARLAKNTEAATDDWPFFYMRERTYPISYAVMIVILLTLSLGLLKRNLGTVSLWSAGNASFFFLGAGFMLVETKTITELGLVFGNTWSVMAVAITGILLMGFLANLWVMQRGPVHQGGAYALLFAALVLGLVVTRLSMAGVVLPWPRLLFPLALCLPLFFAGLIFSSALAQRGTLGAALSANLFGAILGGFLEYNSMYWGYSSLYPLGIALYGLAGVCSRRAASASSAATNDTSTEALPCLVGEQAA